MPIDSVSEGITPSITPATTEQIGVVTPQSQTIQPSGSPGGLAGLKDKILRPFSNPEPIPSPSPSMPTLVIGETPAAPEPIITTLTPALEPVPMPSAIPASPPQIITSADTSPFARATEQSTGRFEETPAIEPTATPLTPGLAAAEPAPILPAFEPSSTPPDATPAVEPADQGAEQNSADAAIAANEAEQAKILQPLTENTGEISAKWNLTPEQKQELADIARESFLQSLENLAGGTPEPKNTAASQATLADLGTSALDPSTNKPPNY